MRKVVGGKRDRKREDWDFRILAFRTIILNVKLF